MWPPAIGGPHPTSTRVSALVDAVYTNTSETLVGSSTDPATSNPSVEANAIRDPSAVIEIAGDDTGNGDSSPPGRTLIRRVRPAVRSRRKTSHALLVSPGTRLLASDRNATYRPL